LLIGDLKGKSPDSSNAKGSSQQPYREHEYLPDQGEHSMNGDSEEAEWKQQKPDERVEDESEQCQRPAQNKKHAPEQKREHGKLLYK
jgi:hypothetical protein